MTKKIKVVILFGGKSAEHEVSLASAKNIISALDKNQYEIIPLFIPKSGKLPKFPKAIDIVFPILHGPFGEDGTIQGMLKLMGIPFVGASVLGSAIGMDKDVQKRLLWDAGINIAKFVVLTSPTPLSPFPYPVFVKPANLGSSIGVFKVKTEREFNCAIINAFKYDLKIIIEEFIFGREIEVSVLGNDNPIASLPGEIIVNHEFYDYDAKYIDENGASLKIPADLPPKLVKEFQNLAVKTFKTLECQGMARVDFFLTPLNKIYVNEINTIPGFTNSSMYPKLWEASGVSQSKLLDKLISLALVRFQKEQKLKTSRA